MGSADGCQFAHYLPLLPRGRAVHEAATPRQIINVSSGTMFYGAPLVAHYVTSKAGVIGLSRSLARELGEYNINVNAVAPGLTLSLDEVSEARMAQNQQRLQARALKRTDVPQDLVGTIVFLCSPESDFMTGQTLVVDGGAQMH